MTRISGGRDTAASARAFLEHYIEAFNNEDLEQWQRCFSFPHMRVAAGKSTIVSDVSELRTSFDVLRTQGWVRTRIDGLEVLGYSESPAGSSAMVRLEFSRLRGDDSALFAASGCYTIVRISAEAGENGQGVVSSENEPNWGIAVMMLTDIRT